MKSWSDRDAGVIPATGLLRLQFFVAVLGGGAVAGLFGWLAGGSFAFGALMMLAGNRYLRRRIEDAAGLGVEDGRRLLYRAAVQRFAAIFVLLILACAIGLHLLAVAAGIFAAQFMVFLYGLRQAMREKGQNE